MILSSLISILIWKFGIFFKNKYFTRSWILGLWLWSIDFLIVANETKVYFTITIIYTNGKVFMSFKYILNLISLFFTFSSKFYN